MGIKDLQMSESRRNLFRRFTTQPGPIVTAGQSEETVADRLLDFGISRRGFLQFSAGMAVMMGLPPSTMKAMADSFLNTPLDQLKPVIYMSFQECTGCLESLVNLTSLVLPIQPQPATQPFYDVYPNKEKPFPAPFDPSLSQFRITNALFTLLSLDYQETIMAAAGTQAEDWRNSLIFPAEDPRNPNPEYSQSGNYVLVVDGSIPKNANSGFFVSGGQSGVRRFMEAAQYAEAIVAVGTCASFGGIPHARPNPTGAVSVFELLEQQNGSAPKNLINIPGCPPIAEVIAAVLFYYITKGLPDLDGLLRPKMFYGLTTTRNGTTVNRTVHSDCLRRDHFGNGIIGQGGTGNYVESFEELQEESKRLWCLRKLGCKGPRTYNACTTVQWNQGTSYPMKSGHGCIGCAEPNFWDGVYTPPTTPNPTATWPTWTELKAFTAADPNDPTPPDSTFAFKGLYDPY